MENVEDVYALAPIQEGLLFHTVSEPASGMFVSQVSCRLLGELELGVFRQAWDQVAARHSSLRTCFLWDGLDEPLQVVRERIDIPWQEEDWSGLNDTETEQRLAVRLQEDRLRGFDLANAPLLRMMLFRLDGVSWRWVWTFHHLICDGWSSALVLKEVFKVYMAARRDEDVWQADAYQYRDYIAWHAQRELAQAEAFWRNELAGFAQPARLNVLHPESVPEHAGGRREKQCLSAGLTSALSALAAERRVTLNTLVQAAWGLLLSKYAHTDDVVFGVTMSGRPAELEGVEGGVGLFINTLPMRVRVDATLPLGDWLKQLQEKQFAIHRWEFTPLVKLQHWSALPQGEPLFESILVFENYPATGDLLHPPDGEVRNLDIFEHSNYPLAILVVPGEQLEIIGVYGGAHFDEVTISRLLERLAWLLESFVESPHAGLGSFSLSTDSDRRQMFEAWNDTQADLPVGRRVHDLIESAAAGEPEAVAVVFGGQQLTYRELIEDATRIARGLRELGVGAGTCVGLFTERGIEMVVAILGILKAGGAYVPMDPGYPVEQIRFIVGDAQLPVLLTHQDLVRSLPKTTAQVVTIDSLMAPETGTALNPAVSEPGGEDLAYVIYTSGSSGRPKGVMVTHQNLVASTMARFDYYPGPVGRFLLLSSFAFDSSVAGIFWTLCTGGVLVLPAPRMEHDLERLTRLIEETQVTHMLCLPALYQLIAEYARANQLRSLQLVIVAGEACSPSVVRQHLTRLPRTRMFNEYGPTEATVWSTVHEIDHRDAGVVVPIGRPVANMRVFLLDRHQQRVPVGVCGEIYLSGTGVTRGYLNQAELTAEKFVSLSFDGEGEERMYRSGDLACYREDGSLVFLGRADAQVKIRGYRIELSGIEETLTAHSEVAEAAVSLSDAPGGKPRKQLVAYVVYGHSDREMSDGLSQQAGVQHYLGERLPDHMIPEQFVTLSSLPKLPNGKTDYRALPEAVVSGSESEAPLIAPRTEEEKTLAAIWSELLGVDRVGIDDNFFGLGGDSIVSIQLISRARQAGLHIEPRHMLRHPTVAGLAQVAGSQRAIEAEQGPVSGDNPLTPVQAWFFGLNMAMPNHWNQSCLLAASVDLDADALSKALDGIARHHDVLRSRFEGQGIRRRQVVSDPGGFRLPLAVIDLPARPGEEKARIRRRHIEEVQAGLDLAAGPLARAVLFRLGPEGSDSLLFAVHHLIIDAVSWGILIEDLETAYGQVRAGKPVDLPPKTVSYQHWAGHLAVFSNSDIAAAEAAHWTGVSGDTVGTFPIDFTDRGAATEASAQSVTVSLPDALSDALLKSAHDAYQTRAEDLLLAALLLGYNRWSGQDHLRLALEGHGRADRFEGIDVSRTVGWFTVVYPVDLVLENPTDPGAIIKSVKERLRSTPGDGLAYGTTRYLGDDRQAARLLENKPQPLLLFNYLSRVRHADSGRLFRRVSGVEDSSRDPQNIRPYLLEINAAIGRDGFGFDLIYSETCHRRESVEAFSRHLLDALNLLIDHCRSPAAGGYTPSDFPDAEMSQEELDHFLDGIG